MTAEDTARWLFDHHGGYCTTHLRPGNCKHVPVWRTIEHLASQSDGTVRVEPLGSSLEGRSIRSVTTGTGPTAVLLWSQMHGNETTATLALCDILRFLVEHRPWPTWLVHVLDTLTVTMIPMLNPDGAEYGRRQTASLIDLNRDALALRTPEARILRGIHASLRPSFALNLHDQGTSSAGPSASVAAVALLAPPADREKTITSPRAAAMRLGAAIVTALRPLADGHLAAYDDTFEPRAFGDNMQAWGTATLLIESGQWPGDPEKEMVRRLTFAAILTALSTIADGSLASVDRSSYDRLPLNGKQVYDLIVRNIELRHASGWVQRVDLGFTQDTVNGGGLLLKEIGDLRSFGGLQEVEGMDRWVEVSELKIDQQTELRWLRDLLESR